MAEIVLASLVGEHWFSGADFDILPADPDGYWYEEASLFRFVLDGVTYVARSDPSDGYRSSMDGLTIGDGGRPVPHVHPVRILAKMKEDGKYERHETLQMFVVATGALVAEVGTDNTDDYYPSFVASFDPRSLPANAPVVIEEQKIEVLRRAFRFGAHG